MELLQNIFYLLLIVAFLGVYFGSAAWAVGDAQKRGHTGGIIVVLFWLFGPLSAIIWLISRPRTRLIERAPQDYTNADDALAAASQLDKLGEWDAAIAAYENAGQRWPEHEHYISECMTRIREKQTLA